MKSKTVGDMHVTEGREVDRITVDLVLRARAKMAEEGLCAHIVAEMIKELPARKKSKKLEGASKLASWNKEEPPGQLRSRQRCRNGTRHASFYVGGVDGIGSQHFQVMITQLLQKHWKWLEERRNNTWPGSEKRLTMYIACQDIKTALTWLANTCGRARHTWMNHRSNVTRNEKFGRSCHLRKR